MELEFSFKLKIRRIPRIIRSIRSIRSIFQVTKSVVSSECGQISNSIQLKCHHNNKRVQILPINWIKFNFRDKNEMVWSEFWCLSEPRSKSVTLSRR